MLSTIDRILVDSFAIAISLSLGSISTVGMRLGTVSTIDMAISTVQRSCLLGRRFYLLLLLCLRILGITSVRCIYKRLKAFTVSGVLLHDLLVPTKGLVHLLCGDIIEENARADGAWHSSTKHSISSFQDCCSGFCEALLVELVVIHRETSAREQVEQTAVLGVTDQLAVVGKGGRVGHVDRYGVAVAERRFWHKLVQWRPSVTVCDDTIEHDLVQVWSLKLQHLVDRFAIDLIRGLYQLSRGAVCPSKSLPNELLAVFVQEIEGIKVGAGGDLDQLGETVSYLRDRQGTEEGEIEEGVDGSVIGTQAILVIAIVDRDLDRHRSIN